jgi:hypothetical protein
MTFRVSGAPRPGLLILLAIVAWGAWSRLGRHEAPAADGVWVTPTPAAHTARVPFSFSRLDPWARTKELSFVLTEAQTVGVSVYDASGRLVRRVPPATFPAGRFAIPWDERDEQGREVARGVYFARYDFGGAWSLRRLLFVGGMP